MFAEGSVAIDELCLLVVLVGLDFKLLGIVVDVAAGGSDELTKAEGILVS
jgi:hypothetical protein